jgi:hypothetical protein
MASTTEAKLAAAHGRLRELAADGAGLERIARFLSEVFVERNRSIRNGDFQSLDPASVVEDYLRPRRELYRFVVIHWIRLVFLPGLRPKAAEGLLVFGLGRLFSTYNDMGVQHCTDVDLNFVARDGASDADLGYLRERLEALQAELRENFGVRLELCADYTLLREGEVAARLGHEDEGIREANRRFYKSNEGSISVIQDQGEMRERLFSRVRSEPDSRLFENYLGLESGKQSYAKLRVGERLRLVAEGGQEVASASVIGSKPFDAYCKRLFPRRHFLSPPDWHFSMKYFVNRVYDYVAAMRNLGHGLEEIGFDTPDPDLDERASSSRRARTGLDPDYRYLRNAHKLMLYLQELITIAMPTYNEDSDYSYISRARFLSFMELGGDKFRRDFDGMIARGDLLYMSDRERYRLLEQKIAAKARDRCLAGKTPELELYPPDFAYELIYRDGHDYKICVPYSWADAGYFVFSAIAERISKIVDERLVPRLPSFGMGAEALGRYEAVRAPR